MFPSNKKRTMKKKKRPAVEFVENIKNTKKNLEKVKSSPYATLVFIQKVRKMIVFPLILFVAWKGYDIVTGYHADGFMNTVGKIIMLGVFLYLIYRIYATIPEAEKRIKYYKKYPHVINYCPTNVKEDVDDILNKIKSNQENLKEAEKKCLKKTKKKKKQ